MKERGPRPAPEQNPIDKLVDKKARIDDLRLARNPVFERLETESLVVERVRGELAGASGFLLKEIETRLVDEASALLGSTFKAGSYKPLDLFKDIGIEPIAPENQPPQKETPKKKRPEKSRGLKDARPVEFTLRSGKKLRGKEGKGVKLLGREKNNRRSKTHELDRDQLAAELYPGVSIDKARKMVNKTMRSARKHLLAGSRLDLITRRDYKNGTTYYSLVDRKPRKKR